MEQATGRVLALEVDDLADRHRWRVTPSHSMNMTTGMAVLLARLAR
ncbi:MAG: hypothetical protein U1F49_13715 [Rubrivivax sp.]